MGSSDISPANKSTLAAYSNSLTSLVDPEGGHANTSLDYGGASASTASLRSDEESETASILLENSNAKFNPKCVFESDSWGKHAVAGMGDEISNLLKNIVGSGGLSIPGGIAAFANAPSAIWPSIAVIWIMGIANAYSFSLLGRICAITKSHSYSMAWERTVGRRYGTKYQLFVDVVVFGKAILGTWSFSIIIASTCTPLYRWLLENWAGMFDLGSDNSEPESVSPASVLIMITTFLLLPMCLSQRLASLSVFSAIGTLGTLVTISTLILRYLDGSYLEGGKFYDDLSIHQRPSFGSDRGASAFLSFKSLTLISILSTGYIAHYNAPKYYYELKDHTTGRFNTVVTFGFLFAAITYTIVSCMGFLTFGENSMGFVLDNYSYRDPLATVARFGVAVSVIFAYPLLFHGGRDGLVSLVNTVSTSTTNGSSFNNSNSTRIRDPTQMESNIVTVLLLSAVTALAIYVNDLTFVLSFSGATMSSLIIYIFPPFMFSSLVKNCCCFVSDETDREVRLGYAMMFIGGILGIAGAYVSVERAFF